MFTHLIHRPRTGAAWQKIPWHDPEFSRRMLAEHLTQAHDMASRRQTIIDQQVAWIQRKLLRDQPSHILDLGCGPGFYTSRLTALGHTCRGLDISPASIAYAREQHPEIEYVLGDVRTLDYGSDYDFAAMIFGELNAFAPDEAEHIIAKAHAALKPGGQLLLEVHPYAVVHRLGQGAPSWYTAEQGLFADEPYLCLTEASFEQDHAVFQHYVYAAESGAQSLYTSMLQAYTDDEYRHLLRAFSRIMFYPSLTGDADGGNLFVIVAEK